METKKRSEDMPMIIFNELKSGTIIVYFLPPSQLPMNPKKEWRGRIKRIDSSQQMVEVDILNEGFEGEEEPVFINQIIRVAHEEKG